MNPAPLAAMDRTPMSPPDARVALAGVQTTLCQLALLAELDGEQEKADMFSFNADLLKQAREAWEAQEGGFE